ncbi:MAG: restriction endonuclease subunit S [Patescibacteria group bacterium]
MSQISKIKYSDIQEVKRFDAEYFRPFNLLAEKLITTSNFAYLEKLGKFIIGPFGSTVKVEDYVEEKEYKYIRGKDIKNGVLIDVDNSAITKVKFDSLPKYHLKNNDVLITVVGTLGNVAIYRDSFGPAIFSCKSTIFRSNKINPEFLMIFLDTKYGRSLLMRNERGAIQKGFNLPDLKKIPVPIFSDLFYQSINDMVLLSYKKQTQSKLLYKEAEEILLKELGLLNYEIKHTLAFGTTKKKIDEAKRYDSEYFQPKYKDIIKKIEKYDGGYFKLSDKNYAKISRGTLIPDSFYNSEKGNPYIRGADFSSGILGNDKLVFIDNSFQKTRETIVRENDIVFSLIGSVGATALVPKDFDNSFISNNTGKVSIKNFEPIVLQIIFQSIIGKFQFEKEKTQTAQPKISSDQVGNFKIPLIKPSIQKQIAEKIQESHKLRKESKDLLEEAKRKVEEEIEKPAG